MATVTRGHFIIIKIFAEGQLWTRARTRGACSCPLSCLSSGAPSMTLIGQIESYAKRIAILIPPVTMSVWLCLTNL